MTKEEYTKERPLRVVTLCSGYDSQCMALERLKSDFPGFDYDCIAWAEIDRYAIQAHDAVFPQYRDRNMGDITSCDWSKISQYVDLLIYSTPCTSISNAGKQEGLKKGSSTASSIIWSVLNAIDVLKPKYLLMENVKALVSKKFMPDFREWYNELASRGYQNFWKVLNAKDYCVPQNRERVFMVSILDGDASFHFPEPFPLDRKLKDILEEDVDEKYYLSDKPVKGFMEHNRRHQEKGTGFLCRPKTGEDVGKDNYVIVPFNTEKDGSARTIMSHYSKSGISNIMKGLGSGDTGVIQIGNILEEKGFSDPQRGRIYSADGISPTINTMAGGGLEPKIIQKGRGKYKGGVHETCPTVTSNGYECNNPLVIGNRFNGFHCGGDIYDPEGISPTVMENHGNSICIKDDIRKYGPVDGFRMRKLTEREVFRLMDVSEENIDKIQAAGISRSQQYKLAGNSIVVSCLYHIFRKMFIDTGFEGMHKTLF